MNYKMVKIATVLAAAAMLASYATGSVAYADESTTETQQDLSQSNEGSGESINVNCGQHTIDSEGSVQLCGAADPNAADAVTDEPTQ